MVHKFFPHLLFAGPLCSALPQSAERSIGSSNRPSLALQICNLRFGVTSIDKFKLILLGCALTRLGKGRDDRVLARRFSCKRQKHTTRSRAEPHSWWWLSRPGRWLARWSRVGFPHHYNVCRTNVMMWGADAAKNESKSKRDIKNSISCLSHVLLADSSMRDRYESPGKQVLEP